MRKKTEQQIKALDTWTDNWVIYSHYLTEDEQGNRMGWREWATREDVPAVAPLTLENGPTINLNIIPYKKVA